MDGRHKKIAKESQRGIEEKINDSVASQIQRKF